jgi:CubicO group peptidase (beta-lactamase class C family)
VAAMFAGLILTVLVWSAHGRPLRAGFSWEAVSSPEAAGYSAARLDETLAYVKTLNTTGLMVVVDGKVLLQYGDVSRPNKLHSVRKSILAMLYGTYVESGQIDLAKTVGELGMTDVGGLLPLEQQATVQDLLTARSGVYHPASNSGDDSDVAPPRGSQQPGTYFLYNNWDFNAAGYVFELESGRDVYDALQTDLAARIGMQDFDRSLQRKSGDLSISVYPAYHMWISTRDMARLGLLMLHDGNWEGTQVIPADWARKIHSVYTPRSEMNPVKRRSREFGWGYLWWVWDGPDAVGAFAGAYSARGMTGDHLTIIPDSGMVIAHQSESGSVSWSEYKGILRRLIEAKE